MRIIIFLFLSSFFFNNNACQNNDSSSIQDNKIQTIDEYLKKGQFENLQVATLAGGCFWCVETALDQLAGVEEVISGYTAGNTKRPTYKQVGQGITGHTEAVQVYFDPDIISFETLLHVFFQAHDPTQLNRQGPDVGTQYRSGAYYHNDSQKETIQKVINLLNTEVYDNGIVTEVAAYDVLYVAEEYHQDFVKLNPTQSYVVAVSLPKKEKVKKLFPELLKK